MRLRLYLSGLVLLVAAATWAYRVNYATQATLDRVAALRHEIARLHEAVSVLEAEWAYLNRPDRLRAPAELPGPRLDLQPIAPEQFADPDEIPFPTAEVALPGGENE